MKNKRAFIIVLDGFGIGEALDAEAFSDIGTNTLKSVWQTGKLNIPNLIKMGLGNIDGVDFLPFEKEPLASVARMKERSAGKDSTVGHWEIAGYISDVPLPTFPNGFPNDFLERFSKEIGREILCNKAYSGTAVIEDYGDEHVRTGSPIVYTSADSVFQIAAHTDVIPLEELYAICEKAREMLCGKELGVGRVIARPFTFGDENEKFVRTADRRDFSLEPPRKLLADAVLEVGQNSIAIGKIKDIFAGRGFTDIYPTHSNEEVMEALLNVSKKDFYGLCFANLVDFDTLWGHRRDPEKYAEGLNKFDEWLPSLLELLDENDLLVITSDHGCDPGFLQTTDHTREYTPLIYYVKGRASVNYGTRETFADIGATVAKWLSVDFCGDGTAI
ncbi:MAG: phosphopentomutase [Ruminococcaceae bacterium]|nr:phosphopentomutase [Oscillospiraceae bacterium]